jgi:major membrane immunogen (membrane-anchored lipoprotein)
VAQLSTLGIIDANMKKTISVGIVALSALLSGCGKNDSSANPPDDIQIRQRIVGSWTLDSGPTNSVTYKSDGSFSSTIGPSQGKWTITNGVFIGIENGPDGDTETGKVVRIDDHEWIVQDVGTTNLMRFHKQ